MLVIRFPEQNQIRSAVEIRSLSEGVRIELSYGTRKQEEIHIEAKAEGIEDREGLQKAWCE